MAVEDNSRMSLRIPVEEKAILLRAAALRRTDLTDFVSQHSLNAARAVIGQEGPFREFCTLSGTLWR